MSAQIPPNWMLLDVIDNYLEHDSVTKLLYLKKTVYCGSPNHIHWETGKKSIGTTKNAAGDWVQRNGLHLVPAAKISSISQTTILC